MLILVGKQGVGKSQFFNRLSVKLDWFSDSISRIDNSKDSMEQLSGKWIMELGELSVMKKSEVEHIKTFLSKQEDTYRQAYGRNVETYRRQCVFAGTTNRDDFLTDSTGNRRFWTVKVGDTSNLWSAMTPEVVNQIWAEADIAYSMGENLYLEGQEAIEFNERQKVYTDIGGKAGLAGEFLEIKVPEDWKNFTVEERLDYLNGFDFGEPNTGDYDRDKISGIELFVECFNGRPENYTRRDSYEMTDIIRSLGWESSEKTTRSIAYGCQKYFVKSKD
jgi:predicted P-loop ATPase